MTREHRIEVEQQLSIHQQVDLSGLAGSDTGHGHLQCSIYMSMHWHRSRFKALAREARKYHIRTIRFRTRPRVF